MDSKARFLISDMVINGKKFNLYNSNMETEQIKTKLFLHWISTYFLTLTFNLMEEIQFLLYFQIYWAERISGSLWYREIKKYWSQNVFFLQNHFLGFLLGRPDYIFILNSLQEASVKTGILKIFSKWLFTRLYFSR